MTALDPLVAELTAARKAQGLSQRQLADRMLCHRRTILTWENGMNSPVAPMLADWADALGFTLTLTPKDSA